jgi:hypothetical protein
MLDRVPEIDETAREGCKAYYPPERLLNSRRLRDRPYQQILVSLGFGCPTSAGADVLKKLRELARVGKISRWKAFGYFRPWKGEKRKKKSREETACAPQPTQKAPHNTKQP